ncbi:MAG: hypothetical protein Tsb0018_02350 [Opitutales bacterium]|tara:strand:+ start:606 stop:1727 length:1122 start_codon:yes stop_codon:yes gene_type:complete
MPNHEDSEKTEEPTDKRLEEAHERGQFAQSEELSAVFVLFASGSVLFFMAKNYGSKLAIAATQLLSELDIQDLSLDNVISGAFEVAKLGLYVLGPVLLASAVGAVLAGGLQSGFRMTPKVLELNPGKLNPASGLKKIFSVSGLVRFGLDLAKFAAVGVILYTFVKGVLKDPIFRVTVPANYLGIFIFDTALKILIRLLLVLGVIAILNYLYQRRKVRKDLRMSHHEVKEERKSSEVSQHVRGAQKQMARRLLQKQMLSSVPTADVIVTNPTHYAVALRYERGRDAAPIILAKGENLFAKRIMKIADEYKVPRVENKPVARMLYKIGRVGESIPAQLYQVVAEILAYVYKTHRSYFHELNTRRKDYKKKPGAFL